MKNIQPIRMCIACRSRHPKNTLLRLKQMGHDIVAHDGTGRSFYLCMSCSQNEKKVKGLVKRFKQDEKYFTKLLADLILRIRACEKSHLN